MTGQPTETKRLPKDLRAALPAEVAEKPRIYAKDLPDELRDDVWAWFADGLEPLEEAGQLGSILLQYPRWFFTSSENRDEIEQARRAPSGGRADRSRSSSATRAGSTRRTSSARCASSATDRSRSSWSTARRASSRACHRSSRRPPPTWPSSASTAGAPRPGRSRTSRPSSGSATCTTTTSCRTGRRKVARGGRAVEGHARPVQQLLRQLRRDERDRVRPDAPRPGGRRAGLTVRVTLLRDGARRSVAILPPWHSPTPFPASGRATMPSTSPNSFPPGPTIRFGPLDPRIVGIGDASSGLCGGMCFFVRRRFATGGPVPAMTTVPDNGSDLFQQLVREQVRSLRLGVVPMRFWRLASMNAADRAARTRDREWPQIKQALDDNKLTAIGLIRVAGDQPVQADRQPPGPGLRLRDRRRRLDPRPRLRPEPPEQERRVGPHRRLGQAVDRRAGPRRGRPGLSRAVGR